MKRTIYLALVGALLLGGGIALQADENAEGEAPYRIIVHHDHLVPTMENAYVEKSKAWVEAFKEADMGKEWNWYTSSSNDFTYVTVFPFSSFADLDMDKQRQMQIKEALGEEKLAGLNAPTEAVRTHYSEVAKYRKDMSYEAAEPAVGMDATFMRVGAHTVKPGMEKQFETLMKDVAEAFAKAGHSLSYDVWEIEFGQASYIVTVGAKDAAHYYSMPSTGAVLAKAVGEEKTQALYAEWRACIADYETNDMQRRPELSYVAAMDEMAAEGE